jgi:hypothetical protein
MMPIKLFTVEFSKDGNMWCCMPEGRTGDLQNSYAGFSDTQAGALMALGMDIKKNVPLWNI